MKNGGSILRKGIYKLRIEFFLMLPGLQGCYFLFSLNHAVVLIANKRVPETEQVLLKMTALFISVAQDKLLVVL